MCQNILKTFLWKLWERSQKETQGGHRLMAPGLNSLHLNVPGWFGFNAALMGPLHIHPDLTLLSLTVLDSVDCSSLTGDH